MDMLHHRLQQWLKTVSSQWDPYAISPCKYGINSCALAAHYALLIMVGVHEMKKAVKPFLHRYQNKEEDPRANHI